VPGFAVGVVEAGAAVAVAAEEEAGDSAKGVEWEDVPGVFGDDVGGEEVDFAGKVGDGASVAAAVGVDAVEAVEIWVEHFTWTRQSGGEGSGGVGQIGFRLSASGFRRFVRRRLRTSRQSRLRVSRWRQSRMTS